MQSIILIIHVLIAVCLIALVLLQHGKGADAGAAFGSGSSNTMFGSVGATPFFNENNDFFSGGFFCDQYWPELFGLATSRNDGASFAIHANSAAKCA